MANPLSKASIQAAMQKVAGRADAERLPDFGSGMQPTLVMYEFFKEEIEEVVAKFLTGAVHMAEASSDPCFSWTKTFLQQTVTAIDLFRGVKKGDMNSNYIESYW